MRYSAVKVRLVGFGAGSTGPPSAAEFGLFIVRGDSRHALKESELGEVRVSHHSLTKRGSAENGYWFGSASVRALTDPKRNSALADLLVRYQRAAQWARENPSEWAKKYAKAVGLDLRVAELAQSRILRTPIALNDTVVAAEQRLADLFAAADQIPEAPDFVKWVDRRFNSVLVVSGTK